MRRLNYVGVLVAAMMVVLMPATGVTGGATATAAAQKYAPKVGVLVNDPLGNFQERRRIISQIIQSINHSPKGSKIRVASWNMRSDDIVDALIAANKHGASVRVVIDRGNSNPENPNPGFDRLHDKLEASMKVRNRKPSMTSYARLCSGACRAKGGIAHTKMFLFSHTGKSKNVVMFGSANATDLAAGYQWNDLYTVVGRPAIYEKFTSIFQEMVKDRAVKRPFQVFTRGPFRSEFFPYSGPGAKGDPVMKELAKVECAGARKGTGINGKTAVRIAMTAWTGDRGIKIAERVKQMFNRGCNIRIIYGVMGNRVKSTLNSSSGRGPIQVRQIAQDWDGDGVYDRYLHMKVLTISGVYAGSRTAKVTWNGSSNWTELSLNSDEAGMRIKRASVLKRYSKWVDHLYFNPPPQPRYRASRAARTSGEVDPYAKFEID